MDKCSKIFLLWMLSMNIKRMIDIIAYFNIKIKKKPIQTARNYNEDIIFLVVSPFAQISLHVLLF